MPEESLKVSDSASRASSAAYVAIALIGIFFVLTRRPGQHWGDDFAAYIHHAENIVEGRPYADIGYIFNLQNPVSPMATLPVFPLLLAPSYFLFGLNLEAMKIELILFFCGALWAMFHLYHDLS